MRTLTREQVFTLEEQVSRLAEELGSLEGGMRVESDITSDHLGTLAVNLDVLLMKGARVQKIVRTLRLVRKG